MKSVPKKPVEKMTVPRYYLKKLKDEHKQYRAAFEAVCRWLDGCPEVMPNDADIFRAAYRIEPEKS